MMYFYFSDKIDYMKNKCCKNNSSAQKDIKNLKKDFEILNNENRLRILCLLKGCAELCVCDIYDALDLPQNLTSYHLGKLRESGFIESRKEGVKVIYSQNYKRMEKFKNVINNLINK